MFSIIGPDLIENRGYWSVAHSLNSVIEAKAIPHLQKKYPDEKFRYFQISDSSANTIVLQFRALKLIATKGQGQWELTPYGDNYMTKLLAVPKGKIKTET